MDIVWMLLECRQHTFPETSALRLYDSDDFCRHQEDFEKRRNAELLEEGQLEGSLQQDFQVCKSHVTFKTDSYSRRSAAGPLKSDNQKHGFSGTTAATAVEIFRTQVVLPKTHAVKSQRLFAYCLCGLPNKRPSF